MGFPSFTLIISCIFGAYIVHTTWTLVQLFSHLQCSGTPCFTSLLATNPKLQLVLFSSTHHNPQTSDVMELAVFQNFDYTKSLEHDISVEIPEKTRNNGTLYLHVVLVSNDTPMDWNKMQRDGPTVIQRVALTEYAVPQATTFNLLGNSENNSKKSNTLFKPTTHFKPKIYVSLLTDSISLSRADVPPEMARLIRITRKNEFLPILLNDFLKTRLSDLQEITPSTTKVNLTFNYSPISIGKLRLLLHVENALRTLMKMGFSRKDVDEIKGVFSDTNVYLLCGTIFVSSIHILFDFLSFKNDIAFWRRKRNYAGLSLRTTLWRGFSQIIIFLFLLDEQSSLLVLIPAGIGTLIELWKCKKILKVEITLSGVKIKSADTNKAEEETKVIDREAMKYLSYLLYPLCIAGAVYSLLYKPHKSWYSWTINSLVNGVYAFGFLFMLPQLFVNYKLKSVAALPWRAFMYKAFNTFIDDIFAFIITMPTAHRLACFRDDIVFVIYLYQRWLYPVDVRRIDDGNTISETIDESSQLYSKKKKEDKRKDDKKTK